MRMRAGWNHGLNHDGLLGELQIKSLIRSIIPATEAGTIRYDESGGKVYAALVSGEEEFVVVHGVRPGPDAHLTIAFEGDDETPPALYRVDVYKSDWQGLRPSWRVLGIRERRPDDR